VAKDPEDLVKEVIAKQGEDPVYTAAADILKALVILYGSGWESEVRDVLMGLWSIRGLSLGQMGDIQLAIPKAVKLLSEAEVITVERRMRAVGPKPEEEILYSAKDLSSLMRLFASDREIDRYRYETSGLTFPPRR